MSVTLEDDRIVVKPDDVSVNDFLEYAEIAIGKYGWRQGPRVKVQGDDDMLEVAKEDGLSLHDAIGFTNAVLGGTEPGKPQGKDGSTATHHGTRSMRTEMTDAIKAVLPKGKDDKTFNDEAKNQDEVIAVLQKARGGVKA